MWNRLGVFQYILYKTECFGEKSHVTERDGGQRTERRFFWHAVNNFQWSTAAARFKKLMLWPRLFPFGGTLPSLVLKNCLTGFLFLFIVILIQAYRVTSIYRLHFLKFFEFLFCIIVSPYRALYYCQILSENRLN